MLFMRSKFLLALPLLAASLLAMPALPASAQSGGNTPVNVRGTIDKLSGDVLTVNSREGQKVPIKINSDVQISSVLKRSLADIKPGDYIASTSMRGTDGKLHALEIHIFPPGRKPGEGQRPYDLAPNSLMTNASVAEVANVTQGKVFTVTYKGSTDRATRACSSRAPPCSLPPRSSPTAAWSRAASRRRRTASSRRCNRPMRLPSEACRSDGNDRPASPADRVKCVGCGQSVCRRWND
jgi:hypothetical protein